MSFAKISFAELSRISHEFLCPVRETLSNYFRHFLVTVFLRKIFCPDQLPAMTD
jgi:hypothetical protein